MKNAFRTMGPLHTVYDMLGEWAPSIEQRLQTPSRNEAMPTCHDPRTNLYLQSLGHKL